MKAQNNIKTRGKNVLLAESQRQNRESLVNQLLMAGAGQVSVASETDELIKSLSAGNYDLILLGLSFFSEKRVKKEIEIFHRNRASSIIIVFDDEEESLAARKLVDVFKETNVYLCVLRSTTGKLLKIFLNE